MTRRSLSTRAAAWQRDGFFVVPGFLSMREVGGLRSACDAVLERARRGSTQVGHTTTHLSGVLDPAKFEERPADLLQLVELVSGERVCTLIGTLGRAGDGAPRLQNTHYYHEPTQRDWLGDWHRDSQFGRPEPERERELMARASAVHFRVAFCEDDRLDLVPGSHARWDTPEEQRLRRGMGSQRCSEAMPGAVRIALAPGDACVFHAWSIHRGRYLRAPIRRTFDALFRFAAPGHLSDAVTP